MGLKPHDNSTAPLLLEFAGFFLVWSVSPEAISLFLFWGQVWPASSQNWRRKKTWRSCHFVCRLLDNSIFREVLWTSLSTNKARIRVGCGRHTAVHVTYGFWGSPGFLPGCSMSVSRPLASLHSEVLVIFIPYYFWGSALWNQPASRIFPLWACLYFSLICLSVYPFTVQILIYSLICLHRLYSFLVVFFPVVSCLLKNLYQILVGFLVGAETNVCGFHQPY